MDIREKASIAWSAAYYIREAAILLLELGEADMSDEASAIENKVSELEIALTAEADKRDDEAMKDIERAFERSV